MIDRVQRKTKRRQIILSTHSDSILSNPGIDANGVVILETGQEGSQVRSVNETESKAIEAGLSVSETILPKTGPKNIDQLGLWG